MTLKKYLRPGDAASYLERILGYPVSKKDIFDLHKEEKLIFVARFCGVRILQGHVMDAEPTSGCYNDGYFVVSYLKKDKEMKVIKSSSHYKIYEWVRYCGDNPPMPMTMLKIDNPIASAVGKAFGCLEYEKAFDEFYNSDISYKLEDILVPRAELDALIAKHQADSTPSPAPVAAAEPAPQVAEVMPEALNAKARNTALQIIAALASYQDALDLTQHYKSADILTTHAASTGQPLPSTETVAQWLKAANPK